MAARDRVEIRAAMRGDATPAQVFATLTNLDSHLEWGGRRQLRSARIRSLDAANTPAVTGTTFNSVGGFPGWRLHERHTVTEATTPGIFEFRTESDAQPTRIGTPWSATFEHRYTIAADGDGSRVTYRFLQTRITNAPWRFSIPGLRTLSYATVKLVARRGLRNLLRMAHDIPR